MDSSRSFLRRIGAQSSLRAKKARMLPVLQLQLQLLNLLDNTQDRQNFQGTFNFKINNPLKLVSRQAERSNAHTQINNKIISKRFASPNSSLLPFDYENQDSELPRAGLLPMLMSDNPKNPVVKVAICLTVYSEDRKSLQNTLKGIASNCEGFKKLGLSWEEVAVFVVYDGISNMKNDGEPCERVTEYFKTLDLQNGYVTLQDEHKLRQNDENLLQAYSKEGKILLRSQYSHYVQRMKILSNKKDINQQFILDIKFQLMEEQFYKQIDQREKQLFQELSPQAKEKKFLSHFSYSKMMEIEKKAIERAKTDSAQYIKRKKNNCLLYQSIYRHNDNKMPVFHCVRYQHGGKLASHCWFFQGFCKALNPQVCILVDCGIVPHQNSLVSFYEHIKSDYQQLAGVCGMLEVHEEIDTDADGNPVGFNYLNMDLCSSFLHQIFDVQKAQIFEYNYSHTIDKAFQSNLGFIHVLPGAFSGYNWKALADSENGYQNTILQTYLKPIYKGDKYSIEEKNEYLAEDRIFCLMLYCKRGSNYQLRYLPDAKGDCDPINNLRGLFGQRKRWINGSWFALMKVVSQQHSVDGSSHSCFDKLKFKINMQVTYLSARFSYISVGIYFAMFYLLLDSLVQWLVQTSSSPIGNITYLNFLTNFLFFFLLLLYGGVVYESLSPSARVINHEVFYKFAAFTGIYSLIFLGISFYGVYQIFRSYYSLAEKDRIVTSMVVMSWMAVFMAVFYAVSPLIQAIITKNCVVLLQNIKSVLSYIFYTPTYQIALMTYAFARIDDLSWATKGRNEADPQNLQFREKKVSFFTKFLLLNVLIGSLLIFCLQSSEARTYFALVIIGVSSFFMVVRMLFATMYLISYPCVAESCHQRTVSALEIEARSRARVRNIFLQKTSNYIEFR